MLHEQFKLKNAANTVETAASSSKMLQIPPTCCKFYGKWEVPTPKCCKDSWNGSFQLQNAANSKENGQKKRIQKNTQNGKNINPKAILDPQLFIGRHTASWCSWTIYCWFAHFVDWPCCSFGWSPSVFDPCLLGGSAISQVSSSYAAKGETRVDPGTPAFVPRATVFGHWAGYIFTFFGCSTSAKKCRVGGDRTNSEWIVAGFFWCLKMVLWSQFFSHFFSGV